VRKVRVTGESRLHLSLFLHPTPSVICFPTSVPPLPTMDRDSTSTNVNFLHVTPSDSLPTDDFSPSVETAQPSADRSDKTIATQETEENQRKRKRLTEDDGRKDAVSRFPLQEASRFQKRMAFTADDGLDPQSRNPDPVKPSKDLTAGLMVALLRQRPKSNRFSCLSRSRRNRRGRNTTEIIRLSWVGLSAWQRGKVLALD